MTTASRRGLSSPYALRSFSSARSFFCLRPASAVSSVSMAVSSPPVCTGCVIFQPFSALVSRTATWPSRESLISFACALSKSNSFSVLSFASVFFCSSLLVQRTAPPMAPATTSITSRPNRVLVVCFMGRLPGLSRLPDHQAREEQAERHEQEGKPGHLLLLVGGEEQVVALPLLRPDGDLRLLLRRPGDRVQREVPSWPARSRSSPRESIASWRPSAPPGRWWRGRRASCAAA